MIPKLAPKALALGLGPGLVAGFRERSCLKDKPRSRKALLSKTLARFGSAVVASFGKDHARAALTGLDSNQTPPKKCAAIVTLVWFRIGSRGLPVR